MEGNFIWRFSNTGSVAETKLLVAASTGVRRCAVDCSSAAVAGQRDSFWIIRDNAILMYLFLSSKENQQPSKSSPSLPTILLPVSVQGSMIKASDRECV